MIDRPITPCTVKRVDVGDLALNVTEYAGDGPDVFLLHGIGSREMTWWPVIDLLATHFRLIVPDWRGHGASDKPASGYQLDDYARDLTGLLVAYSANRPKIVGHSLGGMIALVWARANPAAADRLVIEDSLMRTPPDPEALFGNWIRLASSTVDDAAAYYAANNPTWTEDECRRRAESITLTAIPVFEEARHRDPNVDRVAQSAGIQSPVLLIHGDVAAGGMVAQSDADRFAAALPNATAVRVPGVGHSIHRDAPQRFAELVMPFLKGAAPAT